MSRKTNVEQVVKEYEERFAAPPWNLDLSENEKLRMMRKALKTGVAVDWSNHLHPFDNFINERGESVYG